MVKYIDEFTEFIKIVNSKLNVTHYRDKYESGHTYPSVRIKFVYNRNFVVSYPRIIKDLAFSFFDSRRIIKVKSWEHGNVGLTSIQVYTQESMKWIRDLQDIFETFLKPYPRFRGRLYIVTTPHREGGDDFISTTKTEAEKFYQNMVRRCDLIKG